MDKIKLSNFEAISSILIITISHSILTLPKTIIRSTGAASILNIIYVSFIAFVVVLLISKLLKKFPGLDIIDISELLGGKVLKVVVGVMFLIYITFISSVLLRTFANCLQIVYYPMTDLIFIISLFIIGVAIACHFNFDSVFRSNTLIIPIVILSIIFLFIANTKHFNFSNIFPIFGNGIDATFITGASNIFAFGGIAFLYLLPSKLKNSNQFKKLSIISIAISSVYLLLTIASILFMFNPMSFTNELLPLYSAVRYIEFGTFFQRLDSVFLLIWILSFCCYLGTAINFSMSTFKKITNIKNSKLIIFPFVLVILACSLVPKDESITIFLESTVYKYAFLIFIIAFCLLLLFAANLKRRKE